MKVLGRRKRMSDEEIQWSKGNAKESKREKEKEREKKREQEKREEFKNTKRKS